MGTPTITYAYQWQACGSSGGTCSNIGATSNTFTPATAQIGEKLDVVVTATNSVSSVSATSNLTSAVLGTAPANTALPSITGTTTQGLTLTALTARGRARRRSRTLTSGSAATRLVVAARTSVAQLPPLTLCRVPILARRSSSLSPRRTPMGAWPRVQCLGQDRGCGRAVITIVTGERCRSRCRRHAPGRARNRLVTPTSGSAAPQKATTAPMSVALQQQLRAG